MCDVTLPSTHNHHNHGHRQRKWAPRASQDALHPISMRSNDQGRPRDQANMVLVGGYRANGPQNARLLRWWCAATKSEHFEGHWPYQPPPEAYLLDRGVAPSNPTRWRSRFALGWDSTGPFLPAAIMVGWLLCVAEESCDILLDFLVIKKIAPALHTDFFGRVFVQIY